MPERHVTIIGFVKVADAAVCVSDRQNEVNSTNYII